MKRKRRFDCIPVKLAIAVIFACWVTSGCSAFPARTNSKSQTQEKIHSVMRKVIGDSVYTIINTAKSIRAEVIKLPGDSATQSNKIVVKDKYESIIQFILSDPKIYSDTSSLYGKMMPSFILTFSKKKECCIVKFDFGLRVWAVCDGNGNILKMFSLSSDDMLRLADMLFPGNKYLQSVINIERK